MSSEANVVSRELLSSESVDQVFRIDGSDTEPDLQRRKQVQPQLEFSWMPSQIWQEMPLALSCWEVLNVYTVIVNTHLGE